MAVEPERGCGYRKVGGLYLVGTGLGAPCDRLPLAIIPCPTCGEEPRFNRGIAKINPLRLWGLHEEKERCLDVSQFFDPVCSPSDKAWLIWVGSEYTPQSFIAEARAMGVSKRIHQVPTDLEIGVDWVFLAVLHLIPTKDQTLLLDSALRGSKPGVFYAFKPTAVEKIITQAQADAGETESLAKQGIRAVVVPDGDPDHQSQTTRRRRQRPVSIGVPEVR